MGVMEQKKEEKRQALLDAAYDLFLEHGAAKTSVSDITGQAKVAKGTFYLYFKDKDAVMQALLGRISYRILNEALAHVEQQPATAFTDKVIALVDYLIAYFTKEKLVLRLIQRNFSWPTTQEMGTAGEYAPLFGRIMDTIHACPELAERSDEEIIKRMSIIINMVASVMYSAIIENRPDSIEGMKPVLFDVIRKAL